MGRGSAEEVYGKAGANFVSPRQMSGYSLAVMNCSVKICLLKTSGVRLNNGKAFVNIIVSFGLAPGMILHQRELELPQQSHIEATSAQKIP